MGTDWLVKVKCPRPEQNLSSEEEHIRNCSGCPYVIWEKPESVAGFMHTMCGVRVGSIRMAAEFDEIGERLSGVERFTKMESDPSLKRNILNKIKNYTERNGWTINGLSKMETIEHLDTLIEFCKRVEDKRLDIWAWA